MKKTIILLSAKRSGSTALFKCFQKHSKVQIPHSNQKIDNWEIQFWSLAVLALKGDVHPLKDRLSMSFPELDFNLKNEISEKNIFDTWNKILEARGGIVFDKSPQYLGNNSALELIKKYINSGNNVKIISLIRDPRDTITSQYELWRDFTEKDSLEKREKHWINQYKHLEVLRKQIDIPLFYYEKIVSEPNVYMPKIYKFCELNMETNTWQHLKPVSIGRYSTSLIINRKKWNFSDEFNFMIKNYNYNNIQFGTSRKLYLTFIRIFTELKRIIPFKLKLKLKKFIK